MSRRIHRCAWLLLLILMPLVAVAQEESEYLELEIDGKVHRVLPGQLLELPCPCGEGDQLAVRVAPRLYERYSGMGLTFEVASRANQRELTLPGGEGQAVYVEDPTGATFLVGVLDELQPPEELQASMARRIGDAYRGRAQEVRRNPTAGTTFAGAVRDGLVLELGPEDAPTARIDIHVLSRLTQGRSVVIIIRRPLTGDQVDLAALAADRFEDTFDWAPPAPPPPPDAPDGGGEAEQD